MRTDIKLNESGSNSFSESVPAGNVVELGYPRIPDRAVPIQIGTAAVPIVIGSSFLKTNHNPTQNRLLNFKPHASTAAPVPAGTD